MPLAVSHFRSRWAVGSVYSQAHSPRGPHQDVESALRHRSHPRFQPNRAHRSSSQRQVVEHSRSYTSHDPQPSRSRDCCLGHRRRSTLTLRSTSREPPRENARTVGIDLGELPTFGKVEFIRKFAPVPPGSRKFRSIATGDRLAGSPEQLNSGLSKA